jgi:hypothetical protein
VNNNLISLRYSNAELISHVLRISEKFLFGRITGQWALYLYVKPISQCRRRRACIEKGNCWGKGKGNGEEGGGVSIQPTRDQSGQGSHHNIEEGFQVSKRRVQGIRVGISKQKGIIKRIGACTSVYRANRVYIVLIKDCV